MLKKIKKKKRVNLIELFVKYVGAALVISLLFGIGYNKYIQREIAEQMKISVMDNSLNLLNIIKKVNDNNDGENIIRDIDSYISANDRNYIELKDPFGGALIYSFSDGCGSALVLIDENNNISASNKMKLCAILSFGDNDGMWYQCPCTEESIPEIKQLYENYMEFCNSSEFSDNIQIDIESMYVNKKDHTFIPCKGSVKLFNAVDPKFGDVLYQYNDVPDKEFEINIQINDENYGFYEFDDNYDLEANYDAKMFLCRFCGTPENIFDEMSSDMFYQDKFNYDSLGIRYGDIITAEQNKPVTINEKEYFLCTKFAVNTKCSEIRTFYWLRVIIFSAVLVIIAIIFCIVKNTKNKAAYAFEDQRRSLTNNLAHDIKTPLTAISGYAENLQKAIENNDKEKAAGYISSIIENVEYTDLIVNRTLEFNQIDDIRQIDKTEINMREITENILEKYKLMLEEKNISAEILGEMSLNADRSTICSAIENLITNAVKYTIPTGKIEIILDKRSFKITNDILEKINTKDLTMPFVMGDQARSKKLGSGLGLSIVKSAAELNGLKFEIFSSEDKFTAIISK